MPNHFTSLKPKFSHSRKQFSIQEMEDLFGEEVIYLPEMGKMILKTSQTMGSLQNICNFYGLYINSNSKESVFNSIREYCTSKQVLSPRMDYDFADLEELFQSEVKMWKGKIVVYKDSSKKALDQLLYNRETNKTKRSLFDSITCENPRKSFTLTSLCTLLETKVLHCENRLLTYKSVTCNSIRLLLVRMGQNTTGDKKALYGRLIKTLESSRQ